MYRVTTISERYGTKQFKANLGGIYDSYGYITNWIKNKFYNIKEYKIDFKFKTITIIYTK